MRKKDDQWNRSIGSGIASAALRIKEGPIQIFQGFLFGFGFVYLLGLSNIPKEPEKLSDNYDKFQSPKTAF